MGGWVLMEWVNLSELLAGIRQPTASPPCAPPLCAAIAPEQGFPKFGKRETPGGRAAVPGVLAAGAHPGGPSAGRLSRTVNHQPGSAAGPATSSGPGRRNLAWGERRSIRADSGGTV